MNQIYQDSFPEFIFQFRIIIEGRKDRGTILQFHGIECTHPSVCQCFMVQIGPFGMKLLFTEVANRCSYRLVKMRIWQSILWS